MRCGCCRKFGRIATLNENYLPYILYSRSSGFVIIGNGNGNNNDYCQTLHGMAHDKKPQATWRVLQQMQISFQSLKRELQICIVSTTGPSLQVRILGACRHDWLPESHRLSLPAIHRVFTKAISGFHISLVMKLILTPHSSMQRGIPYT
jgi:hypothetical protein